MKKFDILILDSAKEFLSFVDSDARRKIVFNLRKAEQLQDPELFKKLTDEIWEFRTKYKRIQYRLLVFWDKRNYRNTLVLCTNGFIKKTRKTPKREIERAKKIMSAYFENQ